MWRWLLAALAATVVMYLWGFLFWAANPVMERILRPLPQEAELTGALRSAIPESGTYYFPAHPPGGGVDGDWLARHRAGPLGMLHYQAQGQEAMAPRTFALGALHYFFSALLAGFLLIGAMRALNGYGQRVAFVTLLGIFAGFSSEFRDVIWLLQPMGFHVAAFVGTLVQWLLAGLVMAAILKPDDPVSPRVKPRGVD